MARNTVNARARGEWTLNLARDYVDATAFGDTNRTYLVGLRDIEATFEGTIEGVEVRLFWRPTNTAQTATTSTEPLQLANTTIAPDTRIYFGDGTLANTTTPMPTWDAAALNAELNRINARMERYVGLNPLWLTRPEQTPEQAAALELQAAASRRKHAAAERKRKKAYGRALLLLQSHLNEEQLGQLAKYVAPTSLDPTVGGFRVQGQHLTYIITFGPSYATVGTVKPKGDFCIHPLRGRSHMPGPDQALALKLMIETDEQEFLRTGNWSGRYNKRIYSLGRMGIDGVAQVNDGQTSRLYGVPDDEQPTYNGWGGYVAATLYTTANVNAMGRYITFEET